MHMCTEIQAGHRYLTPVILAAWEAELGTIARQKFCKTPSQSTAGHSSICLSSQVMQEAEIRRIMILGQSGGKAHEIPSQWKKAGYCGTCPSS
jgi:hypothetical protein